MRLLVVLRFSLLTHVVCFVSAVEHSVDIREHNETRLQKYLFQYYNPAVRPIIQPMETMKIRIQLKLMGVFELDYRKQFLSSIVWLNSVWKDELISWEMKQFGGIEMFVMPQNKMWIPDLCVSNEISDKKCIDAASNTELIVHSNGSIIWYLCRVIKTRCDIDITKYPFDSQTCVITIGTWYSEDRLVRISTIEDQIWMEAFPSNHEWHIYPGKVEERLEASNFTAIDYYIHMKRKPMFYVLTMIVPVVLLSILDLFCFVLPIESGDKINLPMAIFLTFAVFLTFIADELPKSSESVFIFGIYIDCQLVLSGLTIITEIYVLQVYQREKTQQIPTIYRELYMFVNNICGKRSFPKSSEAHSEEVPGVYENENNINMNVNIDSMEQEQLEVTWQKVGSSVEVVVGSFILIINFISFTTFLVLVL